MTDVFVWVVVGAGFGVAGFALLCTWRDRRDRCRR